MELGTILAPWPGRTARQAERVERLGYSTALFTDSQNLAPDVWGQLTAAATATTTLKVGTGVTNSVTRDPAVTASAALALQIDSGGRAVLAIGRGDSAVQRIHHPSSPPAAFERYLVRLQTYLRGESVDRDGFESRLEWARAFDAPKVPVEVAATGPQVIQIAAQHADAIAFAVGADPDHLARNLQRAKDAAHAAGRDPGSLRFGAFVNCVVHDDPAVAREAMRGSAATFARFSAFAGNDLSLLPGPLRDAAQYLRVHYDMAHHTSARADHAHGLPDEFIDWFGIAGDEAVATERFDALRGLGLSFCYVTTGSTGADRDVARASMERLAKTLQ
jgi:5,10-methylenetetrahydromethanopterin reductase